MNNTEILLLTNSDNNRKHKEHDSHHRLLEHLLSNT